MLDKFKVKVFVFYILTILILPINAYATRGDNCLEVCQGMHSRGIALSVPCNTQRLDQLLAMQHCQEGAAIVEHVPVDIWTFGNHRAPPKHQVIHAIDNNKSTKMLNFEKEGNGFTVGFQTPVIINEIEFTTANDDYGRDPLEVMILGSNQQDAVDYSEIAIVSLPKTATRKTPYGNTFTNETAYKYYRVVITAIDQPNANSFQFAEVDFFGDHQPEQNGNTTDQARSPTNEAGPPTNEAGPPTNEAGPPTNLLKCGEARCVCRPSPRDIEYHLSNKEIFTGGDVRDHLRGKEITIVKKTHAGITIPLDISNSSLPMCASGVRSNGTIMIGAEGYAAASQQEKDEIQNNFNDIKQLITAFNASRNKCDSGQAPFVQFCPDNTMLKSCFALEGVVLQKGPEEISPFEMGLMVGQAELCRAEIPQCMAPYPGDVDKARWKAAGESFLTDIGLDIGEKVTLGKLSEAFEGGNIQAKFLNKGAAMGAVASLGYSIGSGQASSAVEIGLAAASAGCGAFIPGCPLDFINAAGQGANAGSMALQGGAMATSFFGYFMGPLGPHFAVAAIALKVGSELLKDPPCLADLAKKIEQKSKDHLSLEDYGDATQDMGKNLRETAEFNRDYKEQEWRKKFNYEKDVNNNELQNDDINDGIYDNCLKTPLDKQCEMIAGNLVVNEDACNELIWCKEEQVKLNKSPLPAIPLEFKDTRSDFEKSAYGQCASKVTHIQKMAGGLNKCKGLPGDPDLNTSKPQQTTSTPKKLSKEEQFACGDPLIRKSKIHCLENWARPENEKGYWEECLTWAKQQTTPERIEYERTKCQCNFGENMKWEDDECKEWDK